MDKNGWVSIDFLMASLLILLTIPSLVSIIEDRINTVNSVHEVSEARVLAENLAENIEMVYSGGRGCSIVFKLPANVSNKHYKVTINSTGVYVSFSGKIGTAYITPMTISNGKYDSYVLLEPNKTYNISNIKDKHDRMKIIIKQI
jgi:hypothetical protein